MDQEDSKTPVTKIFHTKIRKLFSNITVEPIVFFFVFPNMISYIVTQNINLKKACEVNLNYSTSVCDALAARNKSAYNVTQEQNVQRLVATVNGYSSGLQAFFVCITLLIIGSWSDKNRRRKPVLMLPMIGDSISVMLYILSLWLYKELPVEFNIFAEAVPQGIAGGWYSFTASVHMHINDDLDLERRTLKIGAISFLVYLTFATGIAVGGVLYDFVNHYLLYLIVIGLHLLGVVYVYFRIEEVGQVEDDRDVKIRRNILLGVWSHVKKTFQTVFCERRKNGRRKILLLLVCLWGNYGVFIGKYKCL